METGRQIAGGPVQIGTEAPRPDPGPFDHDAGEGLDHQVFGILPAVQVSVQVPGQGVPVTDQQSVVRGRVAVQEPAVLFIVGKRYGASLKESP